MVGNDLRGVPSSRNATEGVPYKRMIVKLRLVCPVCETTGRVTVPGPSEWHCPACDHVLPLPAEIDPELRLLASGQSAACLLA